MEVAAAAVRETEVDGDRRQVDVIVDRRRRHSDSADDENNMVVSDMCCLYSEFVLTPLVID